MSKALPPIVPADLLGFEDADPILLLPEGGLPVIELPGSALFELTSVLRRRPGLASRLACALSLPRSTLTDILAGRETWRLFDEGAL